MITPMMTRLKKSHEALWSYGPYLAEIAQINIVHSVFFKYFSMDSHKTWWQCLLA